MVKYLAQSSVKYPGHASRLNSFCHQIRPTVFSMTADTVFLIC